MHAFRSASLSANSTGDLVVSNTGELGQLMCWERDESDYGRTLAPQRTPVSLNLLVSPHTSLICKNSLSGLFFCYPWIFLGFAVRC